MSMNNFQNNTKSIKGLYVHTNNGGTTKLIFFYTISSTIWTYLKIIHTTLIWLTTITTSTNIFSTLRYSTAKILILANILLLHHPPHCTHINGNNSVHLLFHIVIILHCIVTIPLIKFAFFSSSNILSSSLFFILIIASKIKANPFSSIVYFILYSIFIRYLCLQYFLPIHHTTISNCTSCKAKPPYPNR